MNQRLQQYLIGLAALLYAAAIHAQGFPLKPFTAEYTVSRDGEEIGVQQVQLQALDARHWSYTSQSEATGWLARMFGASVEEESRFHWNGQPVISSYRYERRGKEKHVHLKFDWQAMKVTNTINGDAWQMKIPDGTQDKLSINLALKTRLLQQKSDASFPVADGGKLKTYDFKIIGRERINTPLGQLQAIKISRNKRGRTDGHSTLWLAPELQYLTIQIEKTDKDGETIRSTLRTLKR